MVTGPGRTSVRKLPIPAPSPGEVLVRVEGCGICGSSIPLWEGRPWFEYPTEPGAPGHEVWGRTEDGRRVTGLSWHGFADVDLMREDELVELPDELDDIPIPGEALGCAVNIVRRARPRVGEEVAIVGMGFLGTVIERLCELRGARPTPVRRDEEVTGDFPLVIEAAGTQSALDAASRLVATGGRLVVAGYHQDGTRTVDMQSWNWRGINVLNAHERAPQRAIEGIKEAVRLAAAGELDVASLITHRFGLGELDAAFAAARTRPPGFLKAVVCP